MGRQHATAFEARRDDFEGRRQVLQRRHRAVARSYWRRRRRALDLQVSSPPGPLRVQRREQGRGVGHFEPRPQHEETRRGRWPLRLPPALWRSGLPRGGRDAGRKVLHRRDRRGGHEPPDLLRHDEPWRLAIHHRGAYIMGACHQGLGQRRRLARRHEAGHHMALFVVVLRGQGLDLRGPAWRTLVHPRHRRPGPKAAAAGSRHRSNAHDHGLAHPIRRLQRQ
mmetsp:Transcript_1619/g.4816  ORF Transcript_1619/g.4816 Transcript_1619/m.4816 type:complete len:223 (+) Transcript_1619:1401-2069(+)